MLTGDFSRFKVEQDRRQLRQNLDTVVGEKNDGPVLTSKSTLDTK